MTIAVGFTCTDGLVLAADSEISTDVSRHDGEKAWFYRFPPDSENPRLKIGIVGAGDIAFIRYAAERISSALNPDMSKDDVQSVVQGVILDIHHNHLYPYPDHVTRPEIDLIVGMLAQDGRRLISTSLTTVTKVWDFQPVGIGKDLANFLIKRFYSGRLSVASAVFLAAQILMHARNHVANCGGSSRIIVMYNLDAKAGFIKDDTIKEHEGYTDRFESIVRPVMFSGPDPAVSPEEFARKVDAMGSSLKMLRPSQLKQAQEVPQSIHVPPGHGMVFIAGHPPRLITTAQLGMNAAAIHNYDEIVSPSPSAPPSPDDSSEQ